MARFALVTDLSTNPPTTYQRPYTPEEEAAADAMAAEFEASRPTIEQRIDAIFPQTDWAGVIFEALYELANDVRVLKGQDPITRVQLRDWLKSKLPE